MKIKYLILSGCLTLLAACVSNTMPTPHNWQAQRDWQTFDTTGRLGVKINDKGSYANFDWTRKDGVETIDVNTPLGNTVGQLCRDSQGVLALDANGKIYSADTPEALSEQLLGYALPIEHLGVWANGEWVRDVPHGFTADGKLKQLGWTISRELNDDESTRILLLENEKMSIRMAFSESSRTAGQPEKMGKCAARG
ncbi:outer membrane lipoprotein LolB [Alysiella crassa]|uniref:Outer-membrane lipoprotein LolB n=1 Tax=Alysiella crassa TaxID=153491 RepID=A0A376BN22_9NEIS|nr:outer membrane lipoprotein LolB [Alysiella crassa]UOP06722.1 outer membrane lipoprotein LolB [Alysiella crassa]SSY71172.1 Outer-membrane lipoprotein lolB precursor [Alysiella crassa]